MSLINDRMSQRVDNRDNSVFLNGNSGTKFLLSCSSLPPAVQNFAPQNFAPLNITTPNITTPNITTPNITTPNITIENPNIQPSVQSPSVPTPPVQNGAFRAQCYRGNTAAGYECEIFKCPSTTGPVAAAAIMGACFSFALAAIAILLWRGKKLKRKDSPGTITYIAPPGAEKGHSDYGALQSHNATLTSELAQSNDRATALQSALLAANASSGPLSKFMPRQTRDDKQIGKEFEQISQEIKDYAGNYFRSSRSTGAASADLIISQVSPELAENLVRVLPTWDRLLREEGGKGKLILVRAAVWSLVQHAWQEGQIFGKLGLEQKSLNMALWENGNHIGDVQFWRRATFCMLANSPSFNAMRNDSIERIATQIDQLLSPLASSPQSHDRYRFLHGIVQKASNLALELAQQVADYRVQVSQFTLDQGVYQDESDSPRHFEARTMDDVMQAYQSTTGPDGVTRNAMEGKGIRGIVSPAVLKQGDHRGENWSEATVVVKSKVLI